jgi:hypothetical protein
MQLRDRRASLQTTAYEKTFKNFCTSLLSDCEPNELRGLPHRRQGLPVQTVEATLRAEKRQPCSIRCAPAGTDPLVFAW